MAALEILSHSAHICRVSSSASSRIAPPHAIAIPAFYLTPRWGISQRRRRVNFTIVAAGGGRNNNNSNGIDVADRIIAASGYLLPFLDGVQYGRYFFLQFPAAQAAFQPLYPLLRVYSATPFASVGVFFALYFLVVRNPRLSRYVRFNTMQAVVLDVLLILPNLVEGLFHPSDGVGLEILIIFYNTVFLYLVACFLVGSGSCLFGRTPRLPLVASAADAQVM